VASSRALAAFSFPCCIFHSNTLSRSICLAWETCFVNVCVCVGVCVCRWTSGWWVRGKRSVCVYVCVYVCVCVLLPAPGCRRR
jgi:hypothetical protein